MARSEEFTKGYTDALQDVMSMLETLSRFHGRELKKHSRSHNIGDMDYHDFTIDVIHKIEGNVRSIGANMGIHFK